MEEKPEFEEKKFCLACPKRPSCRRMCRPLLRYLAGAFHARHSVKAKPFSDLHPDEVRELHRKTSTESLPRK